MEVSNRFYRSFLIFSQEDMGFGNNGTPSGYMKIESRDGKGKLQVSVQNLRENKDGSNYKVYILKCDEKLVYPVCAGTIPYQRNKGELLWDFNPTNVDNTGIPIEDFNVGAIMVESKNSGNGVICPLAAYKDKKVQWKSRLIELKSKMSPKSENVEGEVKKKQEICSKYDNKLESKYADVNSTLKPNLVGVEEKHIEDNVKIQMADKKESNPQTLFESLPTTTKGAEVPAVEKKEELHTVANEDMDKVNIVNEDISKGNIVNVGTNKGNIANEDTDKVKIANEDTDKVNIANEDTDKVNIANEDTDKVNIVNVDTDKGNIANEDIDKVNIINEGTDIGNIANEVANNPVESHEAEVKDELKVPGFSNGHLNFDDLKLENPVQEEVIQNQGMCAGINYPYCNPLIDGNMPNKCANCSVKNFIKEEPKQQPVAGDKTAKANMEKFRKNLDIYFELSDPFRSNRRDYKWWKVSNPVQLNNIFYQCNIKTPLFFNPSVMMAHYKYRYLIAGIYSDKTRSREYIVCGIPGVYGIDDKPFGDMCRWVQVEGSRPRYGAFGYWLVYIDPNTGRFLGLN